MRDLVVVCLTLAGAAASGFAFRQTEPANSSKRIDFVRDVQPIFTRSCVACHGPFTQMAGLRVDAKQSVLVKVVVPGNAAESALYRRVAEDALARGIDTLTCEVNLDPPNPTSLAFHERQGFVSVGGLPTHDGRIVNLLQKSL